MYECAEATEAYHRSKDMSVQVNILRLLRPLSFKLCEVIAEATEISGLDLLDLSF